FIFDKWREVAQRYGFREYDGPPLEPLELYTLKSGEEIVGQLYNFNDKGERGVALRPEMTPTLARMVAAHERNYKKPIKWFTIPQLFRYERQQKGRLREHFQLNADIIGEPDVAADAELIALLIDSLRVFGLTENDFVIRLSSRNAWSDFHKQQGGTDENAYAFYQAVDKIERETADENHTKFKTLGFSYDAVNQFITSGKPTAELDSILNNLAARGLGRFVKVDYGVIRGLAYYTGVVFEAFAKLEDLRAIAGGGRYDNLVKLISGSKVNLPALGFGMGDVVLRELLAARKLFPAFSARVNIFCVIEDESLRPETLKLVQQLRDKGLAVEYSLTPAKPDKQFKRALELNAGFTLKMEPGGMARIKNLRTREEMVLAAADAAAKLKM
ncbi:MAG TPA: ATP phosphoribosyltransferase regulatory subunit, partial [Verrucomicrobiae bacterium]|nr:ATP phosphoribosyltransferase regulatory subunit [Verrucomicrobiae bacterium]